MLQPANLSNPFRQTGETWLVEFNVPFRVVAHMEAGLEWLPFNISSFEDDPAYIGKETAPGTNWNIALYSETKPDETFLAGHIARLASSCGIAAPLLRISQLPAKDWVSEVQKGFVPVHAGRFFVHCSTYAGIIPASHCALQINASLAFGTGEHETTSGCLLMLDRLSRRHRFSNMLDMGCGTGILSIAMAKTWRNQVLAADIDANAVRITKANAHANCVLPYITAIESNGYSARAIGKKAPYDLIMANILAEPLVKFAKDLRKCLKPGGVAVLSGLLHWQENRVLAAHRMQGLRLVGRLREHGWSVLVLRRAG